MSKENEMNPVERLVMSNTVKEAADYLANYWGTYRSQLGYEKYHTDTVIDDALYGLGVALDQKYQCANGYEQFKKALIKHLQC